MSIKMVTIGLFTFLWLSPLYSQQQSAPRQSNSRLVELLEASLLVGLEAYPVDIRGVSEAVTEFDDTPEKIETTEFRLIFDPESRIFAWAAAITVEHVGNERASSPAAKNVQFVGFLIQNGKLSRASTGIAGAQYATFEEAIQNVQATLPHCWPVLQFPFFGDAKAEVQRLSAIVMKDETTVTLELGSEELTATARLQESDDRFDVHQWTFAIRDHRATSYSLDRALDGRPVRYWEQSILWTTEHDVAVPMNIMTETKVIKPNGKYVKLGNKVSNTELGYVSVSGSRATEQVSETMLTPVGIQRFLDEGKKLSRSLSQ